MKCFIVLSDQTHLHIREVEIDFGKSV